MKRSVLLAFALVALSAVVVGIPRFAEGQGPTPEPINVENLVPAATISFPDQSAIGFKMSRFEYDPGQSADLVVHGAAVVYVETGELGVTYEADRTLIVMPAHPVAGG